MVMGPIAQEAAALFVVALVIGAQVRGWLKRRAGAASGGGSCGSCSSCPSNRESSEPATASATGSCH